MSSVLWADLCPHTIAWEPLTGRDSYGKPTYGAAQTFRGRRSFEIRRVPPGGGVPGAIEMSASTIWILGTPDVKHEDRVYVQGDTEFPPIVYIGKIPDEAGSHHVKIMLGSA